MSTNFQPAVTLAGVGATAAGQAMMTAADLAAQKAILGIPSTVMQSKQMTEDIVFPETEMGINGNLPELEITIQPGETVAFFFRVFFRNSDATSFGMHLTNTSDSAFSRILSSANGTEWIGQTWTTMQDYCGEGSYEFWGRYSNAGGSPETMSVAYYVATVPAGEQNLIFRHSQVSFSVIPTPIS